jgi:hypothetical protein
MRRSSGIGLAVTAVGAAMGLVAVGSSAVDATSPAATGPGQAAPPIVDCDSRIQVIPSRRHPGRIPGSIRRASVFAGPVVFIGARQLEREAIDPHRRRLQPVKVPMLVGAGHAVTVSVSPPTGSRAVIEVGLDRRPFAVRNPSVELRPCARRAKVAGRRVGRRTTFLGGFRIDGPMCLALTVEVEGTSEPITRSVAFGRGACSAA